MFDHFHQGVRVGGGGVAQTTEEQEQSDDEVSGKSVKRSPPVPNKEEVKRRLTKSKYDFFQLKFLCQADSNFGTRREEHTCGVL